MSSMEYIFVALIFLTPIVPNFWLHASSILPSHHGTRMVAPANAAACLSPSICFNSAWSRQWCVCVCARVCVSHQGWTEKGKRERMSGWGIKCEESFSEAVGLD